MKSYKVQADAQPETVTIGKTNYTKNLLTAEPQQHINMPHTCLSTVHHSQQKLWTVQLACYKLDSERSMIKKKMLLLILQLSAHFKVHSLFHLSLDPMLSISLSQQKHFYIFSRLL